MVLKYLHLKWKPKATYINKVFYKQNAKLLAGYEQFAEKYGRKHNLSKDQIISYEIGITMRIMHYLFAPTIDFNYILSISWKVFLKVAYIYDCADCQIQKNEKLIDLFFLFKGKHDAWYCIYSSLAKLLAPNIYKININENKILNVNVKIKVKLALRNFKFNYATFAHDPNDNNGIL